jgi:glycosyltransferase involved in cell wall biosynthesis
MKNLTNSNFIYSNRFQKLRVLKFLLSDIEYDSRDKREVSVLSELGCEVIILCTGVKAEKKTTDEGILLYRLKSLRLSLEQARLVRAAIIIKRYLYLIKLIKSLKADCISCHDITALFIAWVSTRFLIHKKVPVLVYDSHEFEAARNVDRSQFSRWFVIHLEHFLIKRTALSIVVNDSIASEFQKIHRLKEKPLVVRNLPKSWKTDIQSCRTRRMEMMSELNINQNNDLFMLMYHGSIQKGRGIENLIKAVSKIDGAIAVIIGDIENLYSLSLLKLAISEKVEKRILFKPYIPLELLWQYLGASDAGMVNIENTCKSYYLSLPNKLTEYIQSETPVIGSDFPEIGYIINHYNIGLTCNPNDLQEIIHRIEELRSNKSLYWTFKANLIKAKQDLCWENEKELLKKAYSEILQKAI